MPGIVFLGVESVAVQFLNSFGFSFFGDCDLDILDATECRPESLGHSSLWNQRRRSRFVFDVHYYFTIYFRCYCPHLETGAFGYSRGQSSGFGEPSLNCILL